MYNNNGFSMKNVILQFLFVALFIFVLVWIFPTRSELTTIISDSDQSVLLDRIYMENIVYMKDGAKGYFTNERLPQVIGESKILTLGEMLNLKIVLPFTDKNGETCSLDESYVEITKYENEYVMKVNLKCGEEENYLLVYMGCYDYCTSGVCEKNTSDILTPVIYPTKEVATPSCTLTVSSGSLYGNAFYIGNVTVAFASKDGGNGSKITAYGLGLSTNYSNNNSYTLNTIGTTKVYGYVKNAYGKTTTCSIDVKIGTKPSVAYLYEYNKTTDGYYTETDWSAYQTEKVDASSTVSVRIKTDTIQTLIGYNVTTVTDYTKPIYTTKTIVIGTTTKEVCTNYGYVNTGSYSAFAYTGTVLLNSYPTDTTTKKYVVYDDSTWICAEGCVAGTTHKYAVYTATPITEYKCTNYETQTTNITKDYQVITGYETTVSAKIPVYTYKDVQTYSYKTRSYVEGTTDTKWSAYGDNTLLSLGYSYTGNKQVK